VNIIADKPNLEVHESRVRLDLFDSTRGLNRGRGRLVELAWYLCKCLFFLSPLPWPNGLKRALLRGFGATVGKGVVIKPRVNIHLPWRLAVGDHAWIGEEVFILNFEPVTVGSHACLSQRAFLCTGNHDYRDPTFPYRNAPIDIREGAWVGAQVFVGPGCSIGTDSVATAGSIVTRDLPPGMVCAGNPCLPVKPRWPQPKNQVS
jgi:putative colanic acid biosynthesis acetyltransferase WcaF